ncbi:MAG TPA: glutamate formimidoyltransferase [Chthoniobacterales bacterium]|jgi:glutamate formiminotransferase/formiminotetrahydrofolate cyclodeaminase|nr:glutamate formimidoyltransferase [Chthoniobacterales bacterium]
MQKIIECVPNFSEGRDLEVIRQITAAIESVDGVSLLNVDPGASTNRTVVTFAGAPEPVVEAAFRGIRKAAELIDMRKQKGAHPRMGATDVCPFIPVSDVSWDEAIACARTLGKRVGEELNIPVYLYEKAAANPERSNLSIIRAGEYEGFFEKIKEPAWKPDFGPAVFNDGSGGTVIGAREFLVAYNVNLNTKAVRRANSVAFDVRENGRVKTEDGTPTGKPVLDAAGEPMREPGMLKHVKAIGWYVEEYGLAQVSMNLTNLEETPLHAAFDACVESANKRGLRVTGSELVGMLPKKCLVEAGRYFLRKQKWSEGASEEELIDVAIRSMGLSELKPFDPKERIIELKMESTAQKSLVKMDLREFCNETLSDSPAPGGGSVAALMGALGLSLGGMVANLSAGKRGWDDKLSYFSDWAVKAQQLKDELLFLVDEDTAAFNKVMDAFGLPKDSAEEKAARSAAIQSANKYAAEIPLRVMETAAKAFPLLSEMAQNGNPASISDVGVGLLAVRACIEGAGMNVRINLSGLKDESARTTLREKMEQALRQNETEFARIRAVVDGKLG